MPPDDDRAPLLVLRVEDGSDGEDEELRAFLAKDEVLGAHVRAVPGATPPDALGGPLDVLAVAAEHGPLAAALATALVGFLKYRTCDISISVVDRTGREVKAEALRVRGKAADALQRAVVEAVAPADGAAPPEDG